MKYESIRLGRFLSRPNRFIALVDISGAETVCHVKNTGRCRELLVPGAAVVLAEAADPRRKTRYDLISVYKGDTLINMDSQSPNRIAEEYLPKLFPDAEEVRREVRYGSSRFDLFVRSGARKTFVEVKGVTLEEDGAALFPDAPTARGAKHLRALTAALEEGYEAALLFVVQMKGPHVVRPNKATDPAFAEALRRAKNAGVRVLAVDCVVTEDSVTADQPLPVEL